MQNQKHLPATMVELLRIPLIGENTDSVIARAQLKGLIEPFQMFWQRAEKEKEEMLRPRPSVMPVVSRKVKLLPLLSSSQSTIGAGIVTSDSSGPCLSTHTTFSDTASAITNSESNSPISTHRLDQQLRETQIQRQHSNGSVIRENKAPSQSIFVPPGYSQGSEIKEISTKKRKKPTARKSTKPRSCYIKNKKLATKKQICIPVAIDLMETNLAEFVEALLLQRDSSQNTTIGYSKEGRKDSCKLLDHLDGKPKRKYSTDSGHVTDEERTILPPLKIKKCLLTNSSKKKSKSSTLKKPTEMPTKDQLIRKQTNQPMRNGIMKCNSKRRAPDNTYRHCSKETKVMTNGPKTKQNINDSSLVKKTSPNTGDVVQTLDQEKILKPEIHPEAQRPSSINKSCRNNDEASHPPPSQTTQPIQTKEVSNKKRYPTSQICSFEKNGVDTAVIPRFRYLSGLVKKSAVCDNAGPSIALPTDATPTADLVVSTLELSVLDPVCCIKSPRLKCFNPYHDRTNVNLCITCNIAFNTSRELSHHNLRFHQTINY